jgi:hypothetical protein
MPRIAAKYSKSLERGICRALQQKPLADVRFGHSRPGPAGRRSSHVRYAPKATVGQQNAIGRDGPEADSCTAAKRALFDHLVGAGEQARRHANAERLRGLEIDSKFVLVGGLHGQISRLFAL